jgi:hypothetical protein
MISLLVTLSLTKMGRYAGGHSYFHAFLVNEQQIQYYARQLIVLNFVFRFYKVSIHGIIFTQSRHDEMVSCANFRLLLYERYELK